MSTIRVVSGTATGPTALAAYDAALAAAGVHNYNLVPVSSVLPAGSTVDVVDTAPDLGPVGGRLTVVEAHATAPGPASVAAALGWTHGPDGGIVYEAAGEADPADLERRVREGLAAGSDLRDWRFETDGIRTVEADAEAGTYAAAVALAVYGRAEPVPDESFSPRTR